MRPLVKLSFAMALLLAGPIGCKEDVPKKASSTKKAGTTTQPAGKETEKKSGAAMCCCATGAAAGGMAMVVEEPACARDLGGKCVASTQCSK